MMSTGTAAGLGQGEVRTLLRSAAPRSFPSSPVAELPQGSSRARIAAEKLYQQLSPDEPPVDTTRFGPPTIAREPVATGYLGEPWTPTPTPVLMSPTPEPMSPKSSVLRPPPKSSVLRPPSMPARDLRTAKTDQRPIAERLQATPVKFESNAQIPRTIIVENVEDQSRFRNILTPKLANIWYSELSFGEPNTLGWNNNAAANEVKLISSRIGTKPSSVVPSRDNQPGKAVWEQTDHYDKIIVVDSNKLDYFPNIHFEIVTLAIKIQVPEDKSLAILDIYHTVHYEDGKLWVNIGSWEDAVIVLVAAKAFLEDAISIIQATRLVYILSDAIKCDKGDALKELENYLFE